MATVETLQKYYNDTQFLYFETGANSLHFGLWEKDTRSMKEAAVNLNKFAAECLKVDESDTILDAGCGLGGASIYLNKNFNCSVTGINIINKQLKKAEKYAIKERVNHNLTFLKRDYRDTRFDNESFTKVFAIESVCYADEKILFLEEAHRLLKDEGKLVVIDGFRNKNDLDASDNKIYRKICDGFSVSDFATPSQFEKDLSTVGFKNIKYIDKFNEVKKQMLQYHKLALLVYPTSLVLSKLKIISKNIHKIITCLAYQKSGANRNILTYGAFIAEKL